MDTPAHETRTTLRLIEAYPAHPPRKGDPHYAAFHRTRERLKRLGKLTCWVDNEDCDHTAPAELHHALVEYALQAGVDVATFARLYPEYHVMDDASLLAWMESEGDLLVLCPVHHRLHGGIHCMPYPDWIPQRFWKRGIPKPAVSVPA